MLFHLKNKNKETVTQVMMKGLRVEHLLLTKMMVYYLKIKREIQSNQIGPKVLIDEKYNRIFIITISF